MGRVRLSSSRLHISKMRSPGLTEPSGQAAILTVLPPPLLSSLDGLVGFFERIRRSGVLMKKPGDFWSPGFSNQSNQNLSSSRLGRGRRHPRFQCCRSWRQPAGVRLRSRN
jgi:hypothetical protein